MTWSELGVVIPPLDSMSVWRRAPGPPVNLTYGTEKKGFLHLRTYNVPQKIWQTIWKLETKVVIDKTRVGGAVFAFHKRNCLLTKNLKAEYL